MSAYRQPIANDNGGVAAGRADESRAHGAASPGGSGDGTPPDMERIAKLEVLMEVAGRRLDRVEDKLSGIGDRLTRLEEKVTHLPSKGFIVTATTLTLGLLVAAITLQGKLQALFGLASH